MAVIASAGPSPHSPSLRLGLTASWPSRRHHAQSLLSPSFHNPRTLHVLESHPERAAPGLSPTATMSDDMLSALTPPLHCTSTLSNDTLSALTPPLHCTSILQPVTPSQVVAFESDHVCSNLSYWQSFHSC